MRRAHFSVLPCIFMAGCASSSSEITAQYVSPMQYQSYSCQQLGAEAERVSGRAAQLAGVQDEKATGDAVAMGVGLVLFWPSLFFIKGDGQTSAELGRLRGEFEALEKASIEKNCDIQFRAKKAPTATTASVN